MGIFFHKGTRAPEVRPYVLVPSFSVLDPKHAISWLERDHGRLELLTDWADQFGACREAVRYVRGDLAAIVAASAFAIKHRREVPIDTVDTYHGGHEGAARMLASLLHRCRYFRREVYTGSKGFLYEGEIERMIRRRRVLAKREAGASKTRRAA